MLDESTYQKQKIEPSRYIDEVSLTEIFIGESINGSDSKSSIWKIKKIMKIGSIWHFLYPNSDQSFAYIWDNRYSYTYSN